MKNYGFNVFWSAKDNSFVATCPDFPGLSAFGDTAEEALKEAGIVLESFLEILNEDGSELPKPTEVNSYSGQFRVRIPSSLHRELSEMAERQGVSMNTWVTKLLSENNMSQKIACEIIEHMSGKLSNVERLVSESNDALKSKSIHFTLPVHYGKSDKDEEAYGKIKVSTH